MTPTNNHIINDIDSDYLLVDSGTTFQTLLNEYNRVIFKSIITAFGLDLFIKDQHGGDVDTIHNVRKIGSDPLMKYKNSDNQAAYEGKEPYDNRAYHQDKRYTQTVHSAREKFDKNGKKIEDTYVPGNGVIPRNNPTVPRGEQAQLDHVKSAKEIDEDRGRVLAGLDGKELANSSDNLRFTNAALNNNMRDKSVEEYIAWCESHPNQVNWNGQKGEPLPEEVKTRLREEYARAQAAYDKKVNTAYYLDLHNPNCRQFYKDTFAAAGKRGIQMGLRECLGFLLTDFFFEIKEEIDQSNGTFIGAVNGIKVGTENGIKNVKENYKAALSQFANGLVSGIFSSITTTMINIFSTTAKDAIKIIRQTWASVVEATNILFFGEEHYLCDRMEAAAKTLAAGACIVIGTSVQDAMQKELVKFPIPVELKNIIASFCGSLCTGLLTVSLLFYIDNDPFSKFLYSATGTGLENLKEQGRQFKEYCAELEKIDCEMLSSEIRCAKETCEKLQQAASLEQQRDILRSAAASLGLPSPFGNRTIDDCMIDKGWTLTFEGSR